MKGGGLYLGIIFHVLCRKIYLIVDKNGRNMKLITIERIAS
jgi:hypothetical protein